MTLELDLLVALAILVIAVGIALWLGFFFGGKSAQRRSMGRFADSAGGGDGGPAHDLSKFTDADEQSGQDTTVPPAPLAAIIANPTKQGADHLKANSEAVCRSEGWQAPLYIETTEDDPGYAMAREALDAGVDVVIAAGGDGTVRAVAQALAHSPVPMGIIPMGTGNLLARNLEIVLDRPEWALRVALWGRDRHVDVAHLRVDDAEEEQAFMVMAGIGFDAEVMSTTRSDLKEKLGWLAYVEAGSRRLLGTRSSVRLTFDDDEPEVTSMRSVLGGNCGKVQGGLELVPGAKVDDGLLDVLTISPRRLTDWIGVATRLMSKSTFLGKSSLLPSFTDIRQCEKVRVEVEEALEIQLDGDTIGAGRTLDMRVEEHALVVRVATDEQARKIRQDLRPLRLPGS